LWLIGIDIGIGVGVGERVETTNLNLVKVAEKMTLDLTLLISILPVQWSVFPFSVGCTAAGDGGW